MLTILFILSTVLMGAFLIALGVMTARHCWADHKRARYLKALYVSRCDHGVTGWSVDCRKPECRRITAQA